jgi:hypothetical protein
MSTPWHTGLTSNQQVDIGKKVDHERDVTILEMRKKNIMPNNE